MESTTGDGTIRRTVAGTDLTIASVIRAVVSRLLVIFVPVILSAGSVLAATNNSTGAQFCTTNMAETIRNAFQLVQYAGPLVGGLIAVSAVVGMATVRRADYKKDLKGWAVKAVLYGVIIAPLATAIVGFILNNVVAGGSSCGF